VGLVLDRITLSHIQFISQMFKALNTTVPRAK
jgi:hypothetical protein